MVQYIKDQSTTGPISWNTFKSLGIVYWLDDDRLLLELVNGMAKGLFLRNKDPTECSLLYMAMGRVSILSGLWRTASAKSEQRAMIQFLARDFTQTRWRTAASKNAYALLGKQRFGSVKDAVSVCTQHLRDPQLALLVARLTEMNQPIASDGETNSVFLKVLKDTLDTNDSPVKGFLYHWIQGQKEKAGEPILSALKEAQEHVDPTWIILSRGLAQRRFLSMEETGSSWTKVFERARRVSGML
ncbi:RAVE complex protein Rav1 C-terminal [Piptocephalis cylindrospora]|uniref:RAVE complex protein Rav1 C-terminal n=1 Tax=Piptocephalis cylindrospora TaxID=1907219 RepID=A0A4P9Y7P3_9FUNG|nr:RAVE complex protein Rav1 C-terminal [Piptocephalis cylindrospora]|eukprot:RKP14291.1 RAVE complex protein Rav1 C-terminal [Piptocephalis cylindrospora]